MAIARGCSTRTHRGVRHRHSAGRWPRPSRSGFLVVEFAADMRVASRLAGRAAVLQEFVTRVPNHIPR